MLGESYKNQAIKLFFRLSCFLESTYKLLGQSTATIGAKILSGCQHWRFFLCLLKFIC